MTENLDFTILDLSGLSTPYESKGEKKKSFFKGYLYSLVSESTKAEVFKVLGAGEHG